MFSELWAHSSEVEICATLVDKCNMLCKYIANDWQLCSFYSSLYYSDPSFKIKNISYISRARKCCNFLEKQSVYLLSAKKKMALCFQHLFLERQREISVNAAQEQREYLRNELIMSTGNLWCTVWSSKVQELSDKEQKSALASNFINFGPNFGFLVLWMWLHS